MFKLLNSENSKLPLTTVITLDGRKITFIIKYLINKKDKTDIDPAVQYLLLNSYLDYKGEAFKKELFEKYSDANLAVMQSVTNKRVHPMPINIVHDVVSMFDLLDIYHYIKNIYGIKPPENLQETFDDEVVNSGRGTRVQTYIKDDYFELAATALLMKSVLPIIAFFGYVNSAKIDSSHKEYILYNFIKGTAIDTSPATNKIRGFIDKHIEVMLRDETVANVSVIEKNMPAMEFNNNITAMVMLQKISVANIVRDRVEENIITKMYTYIINKLKTKDDGNRISNKAALKDSVTMEAESMLESYRVRNKLTVGIEAELDMAASNINLLIEQHPVKVDREVVLDGLKYSKAVLDNIVTKEQFYIISIIFKGLLDPRGNEHLSYESLSNLLALGFAMLIKLDMPELAIILASTPMKSNDDIMVINSTVNKTRLTKELKTELQRVFPYNKRINKDTTINIVEDSISVISSELITHNWICVGDKYMKKYKLDTVVPADIKNKLAEFILKMEEIIYNEKG